MPAYFTLTSPSPYRDHQLRRGRRRELVLGIVKVPSAKVKVGRIARLRLHQVAHLEIEYGARRAETVQGQHVKFASR